MTSLRATAVAVLLSASGCSWIGMTRPPPPPVEPTPPLACTTSRAAPILDTTAAILVGVPAVAYTTAVLVTPMPTTNCSWLGPPDRGCSLIVPQTTGGRVAAVTVGLSLVGFAVMEAFAAADGYGWASRCEDVKAVQLACVSGVEASCAALRKPAPAPRAAPGQRCEKDDDCRADCTCHIGHCQVKNP